MWTLIEYNILAGPEMWGQDTSLPFSHVLDQRIPRDHCGNLCAGSGDR